MAGDVGSPATRVGFGAHVASTAAASAAAGMVRATGVRIRANPPGGEDGVGQATEPRRRRPRPPATAAPARPSRTIGVVSESGVAPPAPVATPPEPAEVRASWPQEAGRVASRGRESSRDERASPSYSPLPFWSTPWTTTCRSARALETSSLMSRCASSSRCQPGSGRRPGRSRRWCPRGGQRDLDAAVARQALGHVDDAVAVAVGVHGRALVGGGELAVDVLRVRQPIGEAGRVDGDGGLGGMVVGLDGGGAARPGAVELGEVGGVGAAPAGGEGRSRDDEADGGRGGDGELRFIRVLDRLGSVDREAVR